MTIWARDAVCQGDAPLRGRSGCPRDFTPLRPSDLSMGLEKYLQCLAKLAPILA